MSGQTVNMLEPEVLSSSALKLSWEIRRNHKYIEGFNVKYRVAQESGDDASGGGHLHRSADFAVKMVQSATAMAYVLTDLSKYTTYEVMIQPYYQKIEGTDSNRVRVQTFEDGE